MSLSFGAGVRDSLSNLAAWLGTDLDKAGYDAFTVFDLGRCQIESMDRGDWLARKALEQIDPNSSAFELMMAPAASTTDAEIAQLEGAAREAAIQRTCDFLRLDGKPIGERGTSSKMRTLEGGLSAAQLDNDDLSTGGTPVPFDRGWIVRLPYGAGTITLRPITSTPESPAVGVNIPGVIYRKIHYYE